MDVEQVYNKLTNSEPYHIERLLDDKIVQYIKAKFENRNKELNYSLEKTYNITNWDIDKINRFMRINTTGQVFQPNEIENKYLQKNIMYNSRVYYDNNNINEELVNYHNCSHLTGANKIIKETCSNIESDLMQGLPSRSFKSYGYRNPHEHYYQYISEEIQNNTELPFPRGGIICRNNKKTINK